MVFNIVNHNTFSKTRTGFLSSNCHLYHYANNNPVAYTDPDGNDIKKITLWKGGLGILGAARLSVGVAIDSNYDMAIFATTELGIGAGATFVDETVVNTLGLTTFNSISDLLDVSINLKDVLLMFKENDMIPDDTGKGNLDDYPIEGYLNFTNKIPVSCSRETICDWTSCPVEGVIGIGAEGDKEGNVSFSFGAKAMAALYLFEGTVFFRVDEAVRNQQ